MKLLSIIIVTCCFGYTFGQTNFERKGKLEVSIDSVLNFAEKMPEFPGGLSQLYEYLGKNITYSSIDCSKGIQSKLFIEFIVAQDGTIKDVEVVKSIHPKIDSSAIKAIQQMPNWIPGEQDGQKVAVKYILPIHIHWD